MWRRAVVACALGLAALARAVTTAPELQALAPLVGPGQGVYAQAEDGTVLVAQADERAVHPASVTKVATTLALLERLGLGHRFDTRVLARGDVADGRLHGDLVVVGGNDPYFVYESAFLVLRRLRALGLASVDGGLAARGPLLFNWKPDPQATRIETALRGADGGEAWIAVGGNQPLASAALRFGRARSPGAGDEHQLAVHRSPPLLAVAKTLNGYSNNVFHYASESIGGPHAVEAIARAHVPPAWRDEIVIDNGAGGGSTNRLSPRAAVALVVALGRLLAEQGHTLVDVLPVSGVDPGTLQKRLLDRPRYVVGKTGTFGSEGASALAGSLRTRRWGTVTFAVLNHGVAVPAARARQDAFVRALIEATDAAPWDYATPARSAYLEAIVE